MITKINKIPYKLKYKGNNPDVLVGLGFTISFEGDIDMGELDHNGNDCMWFCSLYMGDSNAPWKPGTVQGVGYGFTLKDSVRAAINDLEVVVSFEHDSFTESSLSNGPKPLPVKSSFRVFLADLKAKLSK